MVFTQDGLVARRLIHRESSEQDSGGKDFFEPIPKEYLVSVQSTQVDLSQGIVRAIALEQMHATELDGRKLLPMDISWVREERVSADPSQGGQLRFVLTEGRHRQVRRVCEAAGLVVTRLVRVRIGGLDLMGLRTGYWRLLSQHHLELLLSSN